MKLFLALLLVSVRLFDMKKIINIATGQIQEIARHTTRVNFKGETEDLVFPAHHMTSKGEPDKRKGYIVLGFAEAWDNPDVAAQAESLRKEIAEAYKLALQKTNELRAIYGAKPKSNLS